MRGAREEAAHGEARLLRWRTITAHARARAQHGVARCSAATHVVADGLDAAAALLLLAALGERGGGGLAVAREGARLGVRALGEHAAVRRGARAPAGGTVLVLAVLVLAVLVVVVLVLVLARAEVDGVAALLGLALALLLGRGRVEHLLLEVRDLRLDVEARVALAAHALHDLLGADELLVDELREDGARLAVRQAEDGAQVVRAHEVLAAQPVQHDRELVAQEGAPDGARELGHERRHARRGRRCRRGGGRSRRGGG